MTDRVARARAAAAREDGLVSRGLLAAAGLDPRLLDQECAAGRWRRILPGVAATTWAPLSAHQRCRAAVLWAGPGALLTGPVGCGLWGVPLEGPPVVDLLLPMSRRLRPPDGVRVRRTERPERLWERSGLPVAGFARCVADATRQAVRLRDARALVLSVVQRGLCSADELELVLDSTGSGGSALGRRALADARRGAWSAPEAELADLIDAVPGLRPYLLNPELRLDGWRLGRPDVWFPGRGIGAEVDSRQHHGAPDALDATLLRHQRFADAGLELVHLTPTRLRQQPDQVLDDLCRRVLGLRPPEPSGLLVLPYLGLRLS